MGAAPRGYPKEPIKFATRLAVKIRAAGLCEDCGERLPLEMHHVRRYRTCPPDAQYEHLHSYCLKFGPFPIAGIEEPDDLAALCRQDHRARHRDSDGGFWWDEEEKQREQGDW